MIIRAGVIAYAYWTGGAGAGQITSAAPVIAGHTLIVVAGAQALSGQSVVSVTDTAGNTYTKVDHVIGADNYRQEIWYAKNVTGHAANAVTVTWSAGMNYPGILVLDYYGGHLTAVFDATAKGTAAAPSASVTTGTLTTTQLDELHLIVPRWGLGPTITWPSGFTPIPTGNGNLDAAEKIVDSTFVGTYTVTHTNTANDKLALVATFVPDPSPPESTARISQLPTEVLVTGGAAPLAARISQLPVEVLLGPVANFGRVSQVAVEVATQGVLPAAQVSQVAVEVMYQSVSLLPALVSQVAVEVMYKAAPSTGGVGPWMGDSSGSVWVE